MYPIVNFQPKVTFTSVFLSVFLVQRTLIKTRPRTPKDLRTQNTYKYNRIVIISPLPRFLKWADFSQHIFPEPFTFGNCFIEDEVKFETKFVVDQTEL